MLAFPLPPEWKERFDMFQRRIGYRLVLRHFQYPKEAQSGTTIPVSMWWLNAGVAPAYRQFRAGARTPIRPDRRPRGRWLVRRGDATRAVT